MAITFKVGIFDLLAEFGAHTLVFLGTRKSARAIATGLP